MDKIKTEPLSPDSAGDGGGNDDNVGTSNTGSQVNVKVEPDSDNEIDHSEVCLPNVKEESSDILSLQMMGAQSLCEVSYENSKQSDNSNIESEGEDTDGSENSSCSKQSGEAGTEANPYECEICKKLYPTKKQINVFCVVHKGSRPYQCDVCNKTFVLQTNLNFHYRTHSTENLYVCDICNKSFRHQGKLNDHYDVHTGLQTFECHLCDKRFRKGSQLKYHLQNHSRTYECDVCKKRFARKSSLREHCLQHLFASQKSQNITGAIL